MSACLYTRDGHYCVFGADHEVGYHHLDNGRNVAIGDAVAPPDLVQTSPPPDSPLVLATLQREVNAWVEYNFGHDNELATVVGLVEEVGEIARAVVKRSQGIRGTREEWDAELRKECADVLIKLCDVASFYDIDLAAAVRQRWAVVRARDWRKNPQGHGIEGAA